MTKRRGRDESPGDGLVRGIGLLLILALIYAPEYLRWNFFRSSETGTIGLIAMGVNVALVFVVFYVVGLVNGAYRRRKLMTVVNLQSLTPAEFEEYVAGVFQAKGFQTKVTGRTGDGGVDIELEKAGKKAIVQCKRYRKSVGVSDIREFSDVANRADAQRAYFVTTSEFTSAALDWARDNPKIKLIDNHDLYSMLQDLKIGPFANGETQAGLYFKPWQAIALTVVSLSLSTLVFLLVIYAIYQTSPSA